MLSGEIVNEVGEGGPRGSEGIKVTADGDYQVSILEVAASCVCKYDILVIEDFGCRNS
jgi:hypothetical protein